MFGIDVLPDMVDLARASAVHFMEVASCALLDRGRFCVALAGGSTPKATYAMLATAPLDWEHIHIFWGDERCVGPEHVDSNYLVARHAFLDRIDIPPENIHRILGEKLPEQAAAEYEQELKDFFSPKIMPVFDLIFLGLGNDGHVASLFPGSPVLEERTRWVVAVEHCHPPEPLVDRVTITLPVINAARQVTFLVSGSTKTDRLQQALTKAKPDGVELPVHHVHPESGNLLWLVDEAARGI